MTDFGQCYAIDKTCIYGKDKSDRTNNRKLKWMSNHKKSVGVDGHMHKENNRSSYLSFRGVLLTENDLNRLGFELALSLN